MSRSNRAVFRMPAASAAIPLVAVLCVTPLATVGGGWWALYAIPVIAAVYIVVTRTTADAAQVTAHGLLGAKRMTWSDMDGLVLRDARWTVAVGKDGRRLPLPMVRPRDLPRLATASGGSLNLDPQPDDEAEPEAVGGADVGAAAGDGTGAGTGAVGVADDIAGAAADTDRADATPTGAGSVGANSAGGGSDSAEVADSADETDALAVIADSQATGRASSAG